MFLHFYEMLFRFSFSKKAVKNESLVLVLVSQLK